MSSLSVSPAIALGEILLEYGNGCIGLGSIDFNLLMNTKYTLSEMLRPLRRVCKSKQKRGLLCSVFHATEKFHLH